MPYALVICTPEPYQAMSRSVDSNNSIVRLITSSSRGDITIVITNQNSAEVAYRDYLEWNYGRGTLNPAVLPEVVGFWEITERAVQPAALRALFVDEHIRRKERDDEARERGELARLKAKYPEVP